jgi:hypothetical protein
MLCLILIVGGLLIMMGQHDRSEALFYYFRPGSGSAEHQAIGAVPRPAANTCSGSHCLDEMRKRVRGDYPQTQMVLGITEFFNTHRRLHSSGFWGADECNGDITTTTVGRKLIVPKDRTLAAARTSVAANAAQIPNTTVRPVRLSLPKRRG